MSNLTKIVLPVIAIISIQIQGCSTTSPMKVALTELGTSSKSEYGAYGVRYIRTINITGLGPEEVIGTITVDPDRWSLEEQLKRYNLLPKDLPDSLNARFTFAQKSKVYERKYCNDSSTVQNEKCPTIDDVSNIKNAISLQEQYIAKLASTQIEVKTLELVEKSLKSKPEDAEKILSALKIQYPNNLTLSSADQATLPTKLSEVISQLNGEVAKIEELLEKNKATANKPGLIVTNWKFESKQSASGSLPGAEGKYSSNKDTFGYSIFANPTVLTLDIGNDVGSWKIIESASTNSALPKLLKEKRVYLTFYQVRAQHIGYAETQQSTRALKLKAKVKELVETLKPFLTTLDLKTLSELDLTLEYEYSRFDMSSNQAILTGQGGRVTHEFEFDACQDMTKCVTNAYQTSLPIISSRVNFTKFIEKFQ